MTSTKIPTTSTDNGRSTGLRRQLVDAGPSRAQRVSRRNRSRLALGSVVMAASALAAGVLYGNIGNRQPVLAVARPVAAGDVIQSADLTEVLIATDPGTSVIDASAREGIVGHIAAVPLVPGSLLARGQVTNDTTSISGRAVVGATLKPGQFPIELQRGDSVIALVLPPDSAQRSAADGGGEPVPATVVGLTDVPDAPGTIAVSLAIAPDRANFVAAGGARGLIVLVLTPR